MGLHMKIVLKINYNFYVVFLSCIFIVSCTQNRSKKSGEAHFWTSPGNLVSPGEHKPNECPTLEGRYKLKSNDRVIYSVITKDDNGNLMVQFDTSDILTINGKVQKNGDDIVMGICSNNSIVVANDSNSNSNTIIIKPTVNGFEANNNNSLVIEYIKTED